MVGLIHNFNVLFTVLVLMLAFNVVNFFLSFLFLRNIESKSVAIINIVLKTFNHGGLFVTLGPSNTNKTIADVKHYVILPYQSRSKQYLVRL